MRHSLRLVVHGGAGSPLAWKEGCRAALDAGWEVLRSGGEALEATVAAVEVMERDGRFNAGVGANLRLDGLTVARDAGVMDSAGRLGAVAGLEGYPLACRVARDVAHTPHVLLVADGAAAFAGRMGHRRSTRVPARVRARYREALQCLREGGDKLPVLWQGVDLARFWNFPTTVPDWARTGTVGAVACDDQGRFAVANSTGGVLLMLDGRVGDSPLVGCGYFAGPAGAVAATGVGEEIARRVLAKHVYETMATGATAAAACRDGVALVPERFSVGLIAVGRSGCGHACNRTMAWAGRTARSGGS